MVAYTTGIGRTSTPFLAMRYGLSSSQSPMILMINTQLEQNRLDIYHTMFKAARRNKLHSAPLNKAAADVRILDLGTGTGIWAIEMAE